MRNRLTNTCIGQVFAVTFCAKIRTKTTNKNWLAEAGVKKMGKRGIRYMNIKIIMIQGAVLSLLIGCASPSATGERKVVSQVMFDHDCPKENVNITAKDESIWSYKIAACGKNYKYRHVGGRNFLFIDVTNGLPDGIGKEK